MRKFLLFLVVVFSSLFVSFSSALTLNSVDYPWQFDFHLYSVNWEVDLSPSLKWITCVNLDRDSWWTLYDWESTYTFSNWNTYCTDSNTVILNTNWYYAYYWYVFGETFIKQFYPDYTSLQCQTEYNLIPISSVDTNYCVENQLCPNESWTGDFSGDLQFSNLYINDILHPWKQNIFVNIPDYIMWDYNVVGDDFNIYVGSGYDVDYINSVIDINSYRPTSSDFTNVFVGGLTLVFPYIVIVLFIVFIRKLIKRIFK